jgi:hypothetical protein
MKILYLHNKENWAIHNVGKLWLGDMLDVDFIDYRLGGFNFKDYDFVWFGFYYIYDKYHYDPKRSILTIHDPSEVYPEIPNWKQKGMIKERLRVLKKLPHIICVSKEMDEAFKKHGVETKVINTASMIPLRDQIETNKCDFYSVFNSPHPRKNFGLMKEIKDDVEKLGLKMNMKINSRILPEKEYIKRLDDHEVYICGSYQEGGPLPAMDAMKRGAVVLTTPVGQIQEIIEDGFNGYICKNKSEFLKRIKELSSDKEKLHEMRLNSLRLIGRVRNEEKIKKSVKNYLNSL